MTQRNSVATSIDKRPFCSKCKANKADILENNILLCAFCKIMELPRHVRKKIEEPDQSPRKLHGNLGKKYVARKNRTISNVRRKKR